jgi:hypothetical protein
MKVPYAPVVAVKNQIFQKAGISNIMGTIKIILNHLRMSYLKLIKLRKNIVT